MTGLHESKMVQYQAVIKQANEHLLSHFNYASGISWSVEMVRNTKTGYDPIKNEFLFYISDIDGNLKNIKRHRCDKGTNKKAYSIPNHGECTLYPLELAATYDRSEVLYLAEGELDTNSLITTGYNAITATTGAGKLPNDLSILLDFSNIVIVYDNDDAGKQGAVNVANVLSSKNRDISISILNWPDTYKEKYDISDYFHEGHTVIEFQNFIDNHIVQFASEADKKIDIPKPRGRPPERAAEFWGHQANLHSTFEVGLVRAKLGLKGVAILYIIFEILCGSNEFCYPYDEYGKVSLSMTIGITIQELEEFMEIAFHSKALCTIDRKKFHSPIVTDSLAALVAKRIKERERARARSKK